MVMEKEKPKLSTYCTTAIDSTRKLNSGSENQAQRRINCGRERMGTKVHCMRSRRKTWKPRDRKREQSTHGREGVLKMQYPV